MGPQQKTYAKKHQTKIERHDELTPTHEQQRQISIEIYPNLQPTSLAHQLQSISTFQTDFKQPENVEMPVTSVNSIVEPVYFNQTGEIYGHSVPVFGWEDLSPVEGSNVMGCPSSMVRISQ